MVPIQQFLGWVILHPANNSACSYFIDLERKKGKVDYVGNSLGNIKNEEMLLSVLHGALTVLPSRLLNEIFTLLKIRIINSHEW